MTTTTTTDAEGGILSVEVKPPTYTLSYSRKVPRDGGFGAGEEASLFMQLDVDVDSTPAEIEAEIKAKFALAKGIVLQQLGVMYGVDEATGVVTGVEVAPATRATAGKGTFRKGGKPAAAPSGDKRPTEELWADYQANPSRWWDNRDDKRNPKAPDFKHKDTGEGLWLDSAPEGLFDDEFVGGAVI